MTTILPRSFYQRDDVLAVSRELLGMVLCSKVDGVVTKGRIVETEAYRGPEDRACHAYNNRRTERTEVMFWDGGVAYVYLCYGIHSLFNVVTYCEGVPHAVLIRAIEPIEGVETMRKRRGRQPLAGGPGTLTQALGITTAHNGVSLDGNLIWIEEGQPVEQVTAGPRVGIDYAGEWAEVPWRFQVDTSTPSH
jgi:DNA-3-methyladenine glycosylase